MSSLYDEISPTSPDDVPVLRVTLTVNGQKRAADVEPRLLLAHLLRYGFRMTGTHVGCDTSNCGACTVLLDGLPIKSCTMLAIQANDQQHGRTGQDGPHAPNHRSRRGTISAQMAMPRK